MSRNSASRLNASHPEASSSKRQPRVHRTRAFLLLVFTGPGAFALDRLLPARGNRAAETEQRPRAATA
ncbi:hypothetical protein [Streptomyces virginiae]|uniref:hypothetical protein n=1 Tax=Streptomyces virginiae TaxID=1961 RepID=UPI00224CAB48|nr:hypothetical protein [Streptomyces virginiae]MCX4960511.1 hypothetical protein [Streptomyces virginiae]